MATTNIAASGIVLEPLGKDNYDNWSALVKNYLMGQDLWEGVVPETEGVDSKESRVKNAKALHIIQLACGSQNLTHIREVGSAKEAWDQLDVLYSSKLKADPKTPQGVVEDSIGQYKQLHMHVLSGEWNAAKSFLDRNPEAISSKSEWNRTALHIAVIAGHENIVKELVKIGKHDLAKIQDNCGYTALAHAAELAGNIEIAKYVIKGGRGQELLRLKTHAGEIPLLLAAAKGHKAMTRCLYNRTPLEELDYQNSRYGFLLLTRCITAGVFDVALDLLRRTPKVPLSFKLDPESKDLQPLYALACMPSAFPSGSGFGFLQQFIYNILIVKDNDDYDDYVNVIVSDIQEEDQRKTSFTGRFCGRVLNFGPVKLIGQKLLSFWMHVQKSILLKLTGIENIYYEKKNHLLVREILICLKERIWGFNETQLREALAFDAMLQAAKLGIIEFVDEMSKANPNLLWAIDQNKRGIFTHAVMNRRKAVFNLIHNKKVNGRKDIIKGRPDASGSTILHMAAYLGPSSDLDNRFGPALRMQREIQWFKEVESIVHPRCRTAKNPEGKKPREVFNENHNELVKAGEKWAKETAGHFSIVGTLIITIMFAAAFTVPGGENPNDKLLTTFIISDAVSLFASSASVLLFIGILTSRYDENDFHKSLPWKLFFGLLFLYMSVVSMIVVFGSSVAMSQKGHLAVKIVAMSLGGVPIIVLLLSMRLFFEIFKSTIRSLFKCTYNNSSSDAN